MIHPIDHTADAGFEIIADNTEKLFYEAGMAMIDMLYEPASANVRETREIRITAPALDILFHDFLTEILQITQYEFFLVRNMTIRDISDRYVAAELDGEPFDGKRHEFRAEIKAVTYHQLAAEPRGDKWFGRVIFDL